MVIFISGSINSGKTTTGRALAKKLNAKFMDIDDVNDRIPNFDLSKDISKGIALAVEDINKLTESGHSVVVSYVIGKEDYYQIIDSLKDKNTIFVTLAPRIDVAQSNRGNRELTEWEVNRVKHHYDTGIANPDFGKVINNSAISLEETVEKILLTIKESSLDQVVKAVTNSNLENKPVLIGIEGYGGSGKTTFANELNNRLVNAYVISIDDFIVKEKINEDSWDKGGFDRNRLEKQVLIPATINKPISYQKLIWQTNTLSEPITVSKVDYLIIEGISCYHPDIAKYYDFKIWIDTPMAIAKERGHARDGSNENAKMWDLWAENDLKYQEKYHPEKFADFVIISK